MVAAVFRYSFDDKVLSPEQLAAVANTPDDILRVYEIPLTNIKLQNGQTTTLVHCIVRLHAIKQRKTSNQGRGSVLGTSPVFTCTVLANFQLECSAAAKRLLASKLGAEPLMGYLVVVTHQTSVTGEKTERAAVISTEQRSAKAFKKAVAQQTGIPGLYCHLRDDEVESLYADDTAGMDTSTTMFIATYVGLVVVPGTPPSVYWAAAPGQLFYMDGQRAAPDNVILLTTEQMDSVLPRSPSTLMFYPPPGSFRFADPIQAKTELCELFEGLLPKLYGEEGWMAAAAVLSTAILPFLKVALASDNAINVPIVHIYGGPGEGKTTFLELICALNGRPDSSIMQEVTEAQLYRRLSALNGTIVVLDDNQVVDLRLLCQYVHSFNQRARSTTMTTEDVINAVLYIVDNLPAMGITSLPTLQRMVTYAFPVLVVKQHVGELLQAKDKAKGLLPGLLNIIHEAGDACFILFKKHQEELRKVYNMSRVVYTQAYAFTAVNIISSSLLSSEKHAQLMAYMYNDFTTRHTEILAQADLKPHLHSNIKTWADHRVAAGDGVTLSAMAADGARLLTREGQEGLWFVFDDMQRRLSQSLGITIRYSKGQVTELIKDDKLGVPSLQMRTTITLTNGRKVAHKKSGMLLFLAALPSDLQDVVQAALADEQEDAAAAAAGTGGSDGGSDGEDDDSPSDAAGGDAGGSSSSSSSSKMRRMSKLRSVLAAETHPSYFPPAAGGLSTAAAGRAARFAESQLRIDRELAQQLERARVEQERIDAAFNAAVPVEVPEVMSQQQMQLFQAQVEEETAAAESGLVGGAAELGVGAVSEQQLAVFMRGTVEGRINVASAHIETINQQQTEAALASLPALCRQAIS